MLWGVVGTIVPPQGDIFTRSTCGVRRLESFVLHKTVDANAVADASSAGHASPSSA